YNKGARIFVVNEDIPLPDDSVKIYVEDSRPILSKISANYFYHPAKELTIIGITGTKGKTTTSNYIREILQSSGINTGIIGTNGIVYNQITETTLNTTPESYELQRILRSMADSGVSHVVMEVSSGGLMMDRVRDVDFDVAIFTNIYHDHIGPKEHPTFEHYLETKSKLFSMAKHGIINIDAQYSDYIMENSKCSIDTFSIERTSDLQATNIELSKSLEVLGSTFLCNIKGRPNKFQLCMPGIFNIYNALAAIATCLYLEVDIDSIKETLSRVKVKGRVEVLPILDYATVIVDFAHNGVSLQNILTTLKEYKHNRLVCLVGSVGKRSQSRRKEIGDVVAKECDVCILTSDNPDYEDPMEIIDQMARSFVGSNCLLIKEPDRKKAIRQGIQLLEKKDIFLIAGRGHESYHMVNGEKEYFSDQDVAIEAVKDLIHTKK
ncbi:MAG TPA: UDP-N-acetylmuramoyl-L-alanyl-D-glutamate--2,6-diaminopimelate ligase, partial [Tissierellaceae bacterium]|nr:UDP-N-acetylmuramoyl-L-alanyl-D-glutamate--2,6-diaminopimelate ligase [Tissierellaceae bacterium]